MMSELEQCSAIVFSMIKLWFYVTNLHKNSSSYWTGKKINENVLQNQQISLGAIRCN